MVIIHCRAGVTLLFYDGESSKLAVCEEYIRSVLLMQNATYALAAVHELLKTASFLSKCFKILSFKYIQSIL